MLPPLKNLLREINGEICLNSVCLINICFTGLFLGLVITDLTEINSPPQEYSSDRRKNDKLTNRFFANTLAIQDIMLK